MRYSKMFVPTLREIPAEAETEGHRLLLRAGMIKKLASGIYSFLPLGYRTFKKIEKIIKDEMDRAGAQELITSALLPAQTYQASGRWEVFGPEMFRLEDRNGRDFCLGPTHEEVFTEIVRDSVRSYKELPVTLYQIQTKYRDEIRPRFGLMRSREFVMKDAYSFDKNEEGLDISYKNMYEAYCKIFDRCGLDYLVVDADSGAMGGTGSQEFMVKSDIGESVIAFCENCGYAANSEKAECVPESDKKRDNNETKEIEKISTPDVRTVDELTNFLDCSEKDLAKTLIYKADDNIIAVMVRGDRELNEVKLQNYLGCTELEMADAQTIKRITQADVGFSGPIGLNVRIIVDFEVENMQNFVTGANETGYHLINVNINRDFKPTETADIRTISKGDRCPECGKIISVGPGIEVGHIFKLGSKYSKALKCIYIDKNGKEKIMVMGSYGIGVGRTMAAIVEQNNDDDGIIWPMSVSPYHVIVVPVNSDNSKQMEIAESIYSKLQDAGIEVIIDDRDERPGVKFKDADLIGIPVRITVGRKAGEGIVEYKLRKSDKVMEFEEDKAVEKVRIEVGL